MTCFNIFYEINIVHIHTHTHTHIYIYIYIYINRTSYVQVHEMLQSHIGDNHEGTMFSWLHIYIYIYINEKL